MTTTAIRERLHSYINDVDDAKIKAIYALFEDQIAPSVNWWEDEEFVAELDERVRRHEQGIDRAVPLEEVKAKLQKMREERSRQS